MSVNEFSREGVREYCERLGEAKVKELLKTRFLDTAKRPHAELWLEELEEKRQNERRSEELSIATKANKLAEIALVKADSSNRIAIWALIVSIIGAIVSFFR